MKKYTGPTKIERFFPTPEGVEPSGYWDIPDMIGR